MSAKNLVARPLASADREAWDDLVSRHGCIFDTLRWTDLFVTNLNRIGIYDAGGILRGGFCVWAERRFGFRVLRNPPFTPHIGPFFEPRSSNPSARTDEQRAIVEAMAECLSSSGAAVVSVCLSFGITDCLPFYWRGYKVIPRWVYRIDLSGTPDTLFAGMSTAQRKSLRKAQKEGIIVEAMSNISELRGLVIKTFERQSKKISLNTLDKILERFAEEGKSITNIARRGQHAIAGVFFIYDSSTAYGVLSGYDHEYGHHGAGALAMWLTILKAREMGLQVFDFSGSVIPRLERYLHGFGGQLTPIFSIHKAWLPIEMLLKLRYRNLF